MRKRSFGTGDSRSTLGTALTRRTFVAGAATLGVGAELPLPALAAPVPANFVKSGGDYALRRGTAKLWGIDGRLFDVSRGGRIAVDANGQRLVVKGLVAGTNIGVQLAISITGDNLAFSSFGGPKQTVSIADWSGSVHGVGIEFRLTNNGGAIIRLGRPGDAFKATLTAPFAFQVEAAFSYAGTDSGKGRAANLAFEAMRDDADLDLEVEKLLKGARPISRLKLDRVELKEPEEGWKLGSIGGRILRLFFPQGAGSVVLDHVSSSSTRWVLRWRGASAGRDGARIRYGDEAYGRDIHVAGTELLQVLNGAVRSRGLKVERGARPFYVEAERFAAAIRLRQDCYYADFHGQRQIDLPVELFVLHARGRGSTRFEADFRSVQWSANGPEVGEPGLNRSSPIWSAEGTTGVEASLTIGVCGQAASPNRIHLGEDDAVSVWLHRQGASGIRVDSPVLRLRRSADALDLGLMFYNFRLEIGDTSQLVAVAGAQRGIRFNPQHLEEECFSPPLATGVVAWVKSLWSTTALTPFTRRPFGSSGNSMWFPGGPPTLIARTQVAGASRVVFQPEAPRTFQLEADALTDWNGLKLVVSPRAINERPVEEQLALVGIKRETEQQAGTVRAQARDLVAKSLVQPFSDETSLELVTGLYFAPDATARFRTSTGSESPPALWTAELDVAPMPDVFAKDAPKETTAKSAVVRAIWANGLEPGFLFGGTCPIPPPFPASTTRQDRIEIALQSSAFGLVGLRAITVQGVDVPNSRVRRVDDTWKIIDPVGLPAPGSLSNGPLVVQEGVFSPAPFKDFKARLTGFGADLDAEWQAEPVAPYSRPKDADPFFQNAFSVERYLHRTRLGSDVLAQVVYKGFLFPYGFRVALVKITAREPMALREHGAMMPLITGYYLIPKPVVKAYPGIYQPFGGREIPLSSARLLGERTPELDGGQMDPPPGMTLPSLTTATKPPGCSFPEDGEQPPRVFWPMLKTGGRLGFEFSADDQATHRTLPMLFVSNLDANKPGSVREVIRYYNSLDAADRFEDHHGAVTIFAPPKQAAGGTGSENRLGSTSFETDHILLKARPRMLPEDPGGQRADADAPYTFDTFMNGADEPPFYPVMEEASISVPPLDRIMGSPQGLKRVGYNSTYVRHGFDKSSNRAELYLSYLDESLMDVGGNGRLSGGVLRTPTNVSGVTRDNVVLGAKSKGASGGASALTAPGGDPPIGSDAQAPWNFAPIAANQFDPASFFNGAKLLGVVDLASVIEAAGIDTQPLLKEVYDYALGDGAALAALRTAATNVAALIDGAIEEADINLKRIFAGAPGAPAPCDVSVKRFYPELHKQLTDFAKALKEDQTGKDPIVWATGLVGQWRSVKAAVDAVIANPSPEPLRAGMAELRAYVDELQSLLGTKLHDALRDASKKLIDVAVDKLAGAISSACFDQSGALKSPWFFEALTGVPPLATDTTATLLPRVKAILQSPGAAAPEVTQSVLGMALTVPLRKVLASVQSIVDSATELEGAAIEAAARAVATLLRDIAEAMVELDILIAAARQNATAACFATGGVFHLEDLCRLALELVPSSIDMAATFTAIRKAWPDLDIPGLPNSPAAAAARQASARLRTAVTGVETAFATFDTVRGSIAALKLDDICRGQPQQIATLISRVSTARESLAPALQSCVDAMRNLVTNYAALPQGELADALAAIAEVRRRLVLTAADLTWARVVTLGQRLAWLDTVPVVGTRVATLKAEVIAAAADLRKQADDAVNATLADLIATAKASQRLAEAERRLLNLASDFSSLTTELVDDVAKVRDDLIAGVANPLIALNQTALDLANKAIGVFDGAPDLVKQFTQKVYKRLVAARDLIKADLDVLQNLATAGGTPDFDKLMARWRAGQFGLAEAVNLILNFFNAIMTGQIGGIFDLAAVRQAAEEAIRQLIPTKVNLTYEWTGGLKKDSIFEPLGDKKLKLCTSVVVDLLDPSDRKVAVTGSVDQFALNLFESPLLVTIEFGETKFTFSGGVPKFDTKITKVTPGPGLMFLDKLSCLLGDDDGNKIYCEPVGALEGLKVGYRYSKELIELGGVQITNFGFDASLSLFFDRREAIAKFAVASREAPCGLIVAPAYYGAGFVSLTTTAGSVVAFEIQLEFGAARALQFGPLKGHASVSAGIYLMHATTPEGGKTRLEGFVHAIGEGHIACFGISVNFEVKVVHDEVGNVTGAATYRFSFRVGFVKVGYGVTATYAFDKNHGARSFNSPSRPRLLTAGACPPLPDKTREWLCYRDNFVADWPGL
ncbi:hypothetical protein [Lichenibacterium ramalinae]|uniref:Uncharacterized protein n=1 Tax=Lichenibacterium ramalinae TaxID=2316527 RepID=A0A4Q2RGS7_9HYPH|nr:hypothetical protein [Lichenibacterium ramalinae]RYB05784.1 hypothetical protein D3272_09410 [Lichenibacterium ramalinae]